MEEATAFKAPKKIVREYVSGITMEELSVFSQDAKSERDRKQHERERMVERKEST